MELIELVFLLDFGFGFYLWYCGYSLLVLFSPFFLLLIEGVGFLAKPIALAICVLSNLIFRPCVLCLLLVPGPLGVSGAYVFLYFLRTAFFGCRSQIFGCLAQFIVSGSFLFLLDFIKLL